MNMTNEEQTIQAKETDPGQMYEPMGDDQLGNKENVFLRAITGDPNRHTPLIDHRPPSTASAYDKHPSSMYTLDTRYQPIPAKVLPRPDESRIYYIDSNRFEEPSFVREDPQTTMPTVFLEPRIISQPILYSIISGNTSPRVEPSIPVHREVPSSEVYSIAGRPRRPTVDMTSNNVEVSTTTVDNSPTFYSVIGTPRHKHVSHEPAKQLAQPPPSVYSIVGSPARTSRGVQVGPSDASRPAPILYTIVDDLSDPRNKTKETHSPATYHKYQPLNSTVYKSQNEPILIKTQQPISKPALYTLVGKPISPAEETRAIPPARKRSPPPPATTVATHRVSHGFERRPDPVHEEIVSHPTTKTKYQPYSKEPVIPKSEMILIPPHEEERHRLPQVPRQPPPRQASPEHIQHRPYTPVQHHPIQLPDYQSNYANRKYKPYRERKYNNPALPVISHNQSERKPRPPLYEPRYRVDRHHPYDATQSKSAERYPVNTKPRGGLWDNGYQTQTDDDEDYEQRINRKKRSYKTSRIRAPWIPVW